MNDMTVREWRNWQEHQKYKFAGNPGKEGERVADNPQSEHDGASWVEIHDAPIELGKRVASAVGWAVAVAPVMALMLFGGRQ